MKVFKFGGGILNSADAIQKIKGILGMFPGGPLLVVISAFGKTTNALENLVDSAYYKKGDVNQILEQILHYHHELFKELFPGGNPEAENQLRPYQEGLIKHVMDMLPADYAEYYDRVICYGELMSSIIVHHVLKGEGIKNTWIDVREILKTDSNFRDAAIDWEESLKNANREVRPWLNPGPEGRGIVVTQGFIGSDAKGRPTSLGREGSDYTASIFANLLDAEEVITWKDVPGILNADPKHFRQTVRLEEISYAEATELAYYGAKVIHPKTVKPLQNKQIPLQVRSFLHPDEPGTLIHANASSEQFIPSFIFKFDQVLFSVSKRDLSFVNEQVFSDVFSLLSKYSIHVNIIQNSALTLTFCIDNTLRLGSLVTELQALYTVRYNENLELITIRHYNDRAAAPVLHNKEVLLEQQNRTVVQYVVR